MENKSVKIVSLNELSAIAARCGRCGLCCTSFVNQDAPERQVSPRDLPLEQSIGEKYVRCEHLNWEEKNGKTIYGCGIYSAREWEGHPFCLTSPLELYEKGYPCKTMIELFADLPPMNDDEKENFLTELKKMAGK